jgi:SOS-response transcriptional repressor LexA
VAARLFDELNAVLAAGNRLTFLTPGPLATAADRTDRTAQEELHVSAMVVPFISHLPLYDIPVAAGPWFGARVPELEPEHWVDATEYGPLSPQYFAVRISGASMAPRIPDGAIAIFQQATVASEGKIVLAGLTDEHDHEAASWVVKRYVVHHHPHGHVEYRLKSDNPAHPDIPIGPAEAARLRIQGTLKWVLPPRS